MANPAAHLVPGVRALLMVYATVSASCSQETRRQSNPVAPTAVDPVQLSTESAQLSEATGIIGQGHQGAVSVRFPAPGRNGPEDVTFPPRNEPLLFRTALETKYRDGLRRQAVATFVDQEGTVVRTQEYLRYRVNVCPHVEAVLRVMRQISPGHARCLIGLTTASA